VPTAPLSAASRNLTLERRPDTLGTGALRAKDLQDTFTCAA